MFIMTSFFFSPFLLFHCLLFFHILYVKSYKLGGKKKKKEEEKAGIVYGGIWIYSGIEGLIQLGM